jgi:lipopolysaccharide/colanic/teichoic acid biosynthesis glycosyltransferase
MVLIRGPSMRRAFDVIVACIGLLLLSPMFLVLAVRIKLFDGGPVFYRARRTGFLGAEFNLIKFRTMVINADTLGAGITVADDKRITPVGKLIRSHKLDEYPQLINIVLRNMNLVGPRPEDPRYTALYDQHQKKILNIRPGITSPASIKFKNETELLRGSEWEKKYVNEVMPKKISIDMEYFRNNTFLSDIRVILKTLFSTLS